MTQPKAALNVSPVYWKRIAAWSSPLSSETITTPQWATLLQRFPSLPWIHTLCSLFQLPHTPSCCHKLQHQMWIHPLLKIVPDKCTFSSFWIVWLVTASCCSCSQKWGNIYNLMQICVPGVIMLMVLLFIIILRYNSVLFCIISYLLH